MEISEVPDPGRCYLGAIDARSSLLPWQSRAVTGFFVLGTSRRNLNPC